MRWPEGPPHFTLNPPYLFFFVFCLLCFVCFVFVLLFFLFLSLLLIEKQNLFSPPRKGNFCLFWSVSLCFIGLPLFPFLFLCLCLVLFFLSSFLSFFLLSFGSLFLSLSVFFSLLCFCFMKGTTPKYSVKEFCLQSFLFFGFLSCFQIDIFFLIFAFS